jgi:GNAT superfamily N-acetyltransferase
VRELTRVAEVVDASDDDDLIVWAAQDMKPGVRAWAHGDAVAVASPEASRRDRLAVRGSLAHAVPLVRHALAESGPSFRPFGDAALIGEITRNVDELELMGHFSWMVTHPPQRPAPGPAEPGPAADGPRAGESETRYRRGPGAADGQDVTGGSAVSAAAVPPGVSVPAWLELRDEPDVTGLLKLANPGSYAVPGIPGVRRWAGFRDGEGELLAVAADAWSAPTVGLLAGVATAEHARGRGLGERVCRFLMEALLAEHGRAALMVDDWNDAALIIYERLGFTRRRVAAAGVSAAG